MNAMYRIIHSKRLSYIGRVHRRVKCSSYSEYSTSASKCMYFDRLYDNRQNRCFSSSSSLDSSEHQRKEVFDKNVKLIQREASAKLLNASEYDYFRDEVSRRLVDRLDDIRRDDGFPLALDIGAGAGHIYRAICAEESFEGVGGIGGVRKLVQMDSCEAALMRGPTDFEHSDRCDTYRLVANEEDTLQFPDGTFDLVLTSVALHQVNDLPKLFSECRRVLKDDGCFMLAMVGGASLSELRSSLVLAEMERVGGVSPHVGPFVDISDIGSLLVSAGFQLPTIDVDTINLGYTDAFLLMEHLQRMGESNATKSRSKPWVGIDTFLAAGAIYQELFELGDEYNADSEDKNIQASVQVVYAIGWTPHESQQQPLERGCATHKFGDDIIISKSEQGSVVDK